MPNNLFWAGSDTSYQLYLDAIKKFESISPEAYGSPLVSSDEEVEKLPRIYTRVGTVGLITISGALVNKESWWTRWAGMTSYESIREALIFAMEDSSVEKILLDIASPGGQVAGCEDCANLVSKVSEIKEISAFSDAYVASAAYWISSAATKRYTSKSAMWGSIGVIMRHAEYSKMREDVGITDTIFRSGPWKGIGGSEEKLSTLAIKDFQEKTDYLANVFVDSVADNLNITAAFVDQTMGQGREFVGQQAVDVGLCTSVESFDAVIEKLQKTDKSVGGITMPKTGMTAQAIAAAASGASPEALASGDIPAVGDIEKVDTPEVPATPEIGAEGGTTEAGAEGGTTEANAADAGKESGEEGAVAPELISALAKNELLTEQLATANADNLKLKMTAESHEKGAGDLDALKLIAAESINNKQIAMGSATTDLTAHSISDLVALHAATDETFKSTFKVGGVTKKTSTNKPEVTAEIDTSSVGL